MDPLGLNKALLLRHSEFNPSNSAARENVLSQAISTLISVGFTPERAKHLLVENAKDLARVLECTEEQALFSESAATIVRFRK